MPFNFVTSPEPEWFHTQVTKFLDDGYEIVNAHAVLNNLQLVYCAFVYKPNDTTAPPASPPVTDLTLLRNTVSKLQQRLTDLRAEFTALEAVNAKQMALLERISDRAPDVYTEQDTVATIRVGVWHWSSDETEDEFFRTIQDVIKYVEGK